MGEEAVESEAHRQFLMGLKLGGWEMVGVHGAPPPVPDCPQAWVDSLL